MADLQGIGYVAMTAKVDATTKSYLEENHKNTSTGYVDINGKNLAVKMNASGEVGFGASTPTVADSLVGIIVAYESDGMASVQVSGGIDEVPTKAAVSGGLQALAVDNTGKIVVLEGARQAIVGVPSTSEELYASLYI